MLHHFFETATLGDFDQGVAEDFYLQTTDKHFSQALVESEADEVESKQNPKQRARRRAKIKKASQSKRIALASLSSFTSRYR